MNKKFRLRVLTERIVDTSKYRYCVRQVVIDGEYRNVITRIEKWKLDYTLCIDENEWQIMEVL